MDLKSLSLAALVASVMAAGCAGTRTIDVPYAFPDQPGALSKDEIQAVTDAVRPRFGAGPLLPLIASGRRNPAHPMSSYALFAAPITDFSARVKVRRQVVCNYWRDAQLWRCGDLYDEFRLSANGLNHVFSYQIIQGSGDKQMALDAVDFMYAPCFHAQYAALGGTPFTPAPESDFVNTILDDGKGLNVATGPLGDGDNYRLEKTDKASDKCGFRIQRARLAKSGAVLPRGSQ